MLDDLARVTAHAGDTVLALVGQAPDAATEIQDGQQYQRHAHGDDQAEFEVGDEHHNQRPDQGEAAAQGHAEGGADNRLQQSGIRGQARHDLAAAIELEITRVQSHDVVEHGLAQVGADPLAQPRHEVEPDECTHRDGGGYGDQQADSAGQVGAVTVAESLVDEHLQAPPHGQGGTGGEQQRDTRPRQAQFVGFEEADHWQQ